MKWDAGEGLQETKDWYATGYLLNYFLSLAPDSLQPEFPEDGTDARIAELQEVLSIPVSSPHASPPCDTDADTNGRSCDNCAASGALMTKTSFSSRKRGFILVAMCVLFIKGGDPKKKDNQLSKSEGRWHSRDNPERVFGRNSVCRARRSLFLNAHHVSG